AGGVAGYAGGDVTGCSADGVNVTAATSYAGGVAGYATGTVTGCAANGVEAGGGTGVGGVIGCAESDIAQCTVTGSIVNAAITNAGGIVGFATQAVTDCKADDVRVLGLTLNGLFMTPTGDNAGGIAGYAKSAIYGCEASNIGVNGKANIGGIAGYSEDTIENSGVLYSIVTGRTGVGGIVGNNPGVVRNVFFLSVNTPGKTPVTALDENGIAGGIAGKNGGVVTRSFYLAPAPTSGDMLFPIVGGGYPAKMAPIEPENENDEPTVIDTCFYLTGVMSVPAADGDDNGLTAWAEYNTGDIQNGGYGFSTADLNLPQLTENGYGSLDWGQWGHKAEWDPAVDYPYPLLAGASEPKYWPVTLDVPPPPEEPGNEEPGDLELASASSLINDGNDGDGAPAAQNTEARTAGDEGPDSSPLQSATGAAQLMGAVAAAPALLGALRKRYLKIRRKRRINAYSDGIPGNKRKLNRFVRRSRRR
ncbi:MAG: hypothetical protein FWF44_11445, partial [Defluviitaleaceae bacterium]|nr:hypothetical protein [Defluviitaleaceae bacterium]